MVQLSVFKVDLVAVTVVTDADRKVYSSSQRQSLAYACTAIMSEPVCLANLHFCIRAFCILTAGQPDTPYMVHSSVPA